MTKERGLRAFGVSERGSRFSNEDDFGIVLGESSMVCVVADGMGGIGAGNTRALGVAEVVQVDIASHEVRPFDTFVLCSDGLHEGLGEGRIEAILREMGDDVEGAARRLVREVVERGGDRDDATVIVAKVGPIP